MYNTANQGASTLAPSALSPFCPHRLFKHWFLSFWTLQWDVRSALDWLAGNVARFINHSCKGNLVIQPVFTDGCNALLYRIALFASEEIPPFTELTYDYGYAQGVVHNRLMECKCGSEQCRKRLL